MLKRTVGLAAVVVSTGCIHVEAPYVPPPPAAGFERESEYVTRRGDRVREFHILPSDPGWTTPLVAIERLVIPEVDAIGNIGSFWYDANGLLWCAGSRGAVLLDVSARTSVRTVMFDPAECPRRSTMRALASDLDGDGLPEFVDVSFYGGMTDVFDTTGALVARLPMPPSAPNFRKCVRVGDFLPRDGLELYVGNGPCYIYGLKGGLSRFGPFDVPDANNVEREMGPLVFDVDCDGIDDMVVPRAARLYLVKFSDSDATVDRVGGLDAGYCNTLDLVLDDGGKPVGAYADIVPPDKSDSVEMGLVFRQGLAPMSVSGDEVEVSGLPIRVGSEFLRANWAESGLGSGTFSLVTKAGRPLEWVTFHGQTRDKGGIPPISIDFAFIEVRDPAAKQGEAGFFIGMGSDIWLITPKKADSPMEQSQRPLEHGVAASPAG